MRKQSILDINGRIFENANSVNSIDIEEGIKKIKQDAFENTSLTNLRIPKTVMEIKRILHQRSLYIVISEVLHENMHSQTDIKLMIIKFIIKDDDNGFCWNFRFFYRCCK